MNIKVPMQPSLVEINSQDIITNEKDVLSKTQQKIIIKYSKIILEQDYYQFKVAIFLKIMDYSNPLFYL